MPLTAGTRIGPFELTRTLGAGGMGEVYRARDLKLGREVAIKVLPAAFTADRDRLARFEREARVLASLNHPHIGAIYGLEEAAGIPALVLELVEGETLAERIAGAPLPVSEALAIARQIADALDAAHEKGIVHRDLKPANIKITPDGVVKVLDFGLAKAAEAVADADLTHSPAVTVAGTRQGVILGTAAYMSPEQARGQVVDKRTDIWAFGCVLYEMLAGRAAFGRGTITDTLAAIVEREPDWGALPSATPASVRRLLGRCLQKDPRRRVRDVADARMELEDGLTGAVTIPAAPAAAVPTSHRLPWLVAVAASLLALAALGALGWSRRAPATTDAVAPQFSRVVRLTSGPAREIGPAISPDGKWVAYVSDLSGRPDVWIKFLAGGDAANLTAAAGLDISTNTGIGGVEIAPDGTRVAVMAKTRGSTTPFSTWELPAPLPGVPRKLLDDGFLGMRWSPDGRRITFIRAGSYAGDALWVADADGSNQQELIPARDGMHVHWPTWSQDGFIYFNRTLGTIINLDQTEIYRIQASGGMMEPAVSTIRRAMSPAPMPDGRGLIYAANPTSADPSLWWRSLDGTSQQRLTTGVGEYAEPRISAGGRSVVFTLYDVRQSVSRVSLSGASPKVSAVTDGFGGDLDPTVAPAGERIAFSSSRAGDRHLWTARLDGSDTRPRKLTDITPTGGLSWSPDGTQIVFAASAGTLPGLWSASVATGETRHIPTPGVVAEPAWSLTGNVIAYLSPTTSGPNLMRLAFVNEAGQPQYTALPPAPPISAGFANGIPAWSPDGRQLAVLAQNANAPASIWLVTPSNVSSPYRKVLDLTGGARMRGLAWTRDGSALLVGLHDTTSDVVLLDQGP